MRRLIPTLLLLTAPAAALAEAPRHEIDVRIDPAAGRIEAVDHVTLPAGGWAGFRLDPALEIVAMKIDGRAAEPSGMNGLYRLPDEVRSVVIQYRGTLSPPAEGGAAGPDRPVAGPEGAFLPAWSGWIPDFGAREVDYRVTVSTPAPFKAVATGALQDETDGPERYRATYASPRPMEPPSLFAGPYQIVEHRRDGLHLRAWLHPGLPRELGEDYLAFSAGVIERFAQRVGGYPYDAFHIVSAPLPVGLGFPGLTYIDRRILPLPFIKGQSLPHEILHNWWGNAVEPKYEAGNWAEGLTTYMADYGLATPEKQRQMRLNWLRDYAALPEGRDVPVTAFRSKEHDAAQVVGYNKVAGIFHMLRGEIGDEAFWRGIRTFWDNHAFGTADWGDLRAAFEKASGRDLGGFFAQWLERPGAPALTLAAATAEPDGDGRWRTTVRLTQPAPGWDVRVPLVIETEAGPQRVHLDLAGTEGAASYPTMAKPTAVAVDPETELFRRLAPGEAPPTFRDVTLAEEAGVLIAAEGDAAEAAKALSERLLDRPGATAGTDHDGPLLVIGTSGQLDKLLPKLDLDREPPPIGSGRAWVARRDAGPVLVVEAADAEALEAMLRPLPHYGRESWLTLQGRKVTGKGVWPVGDSPLRKVL